MKREKIIADFKQKCLIYIPSRGRCLNQKTFENIPRSLRPVTRIVIPPEDEQRMPEKYAPYCRVCPEEGIGPTRQWILQTHHDEQLRPYLIMSDDDHSFFRRKSEEDWHLQRCSDEDVEDMFIALGDLLEEYMQVGLSPRSGNNRMEAPVKECTRMFNFHGYDVAAYHALGLRFDETPLMEDFNVTLRILEAGYPNALLTQYCWDQPGSNSDGGCSSYRTPELQAKAANLLAELHPKFVKVVDKKSNNWEGMDTRKDVRIQWRKAYESGVKEL